MLGLGPQEIVLLCILGMLLFGRKLPEVGRSLGRSIVAFKQGLTGAEDDAEPSVPELTRPPQRFVAAPGYDDSATGRTV